jgi:prepilin-type N-terminal cleavage/methylation domain-containing protein
MRNMKRGFTLIELLIAVILAASGLMVLMQLLGVAIFADSNLEYSLIALNLANEKLEELKDSDYSTVTSAAESSIPGFGWVDDRIVTVSEVDTGLKDVQVEVRWTQKGGQQSVNLRTYIANY